MPKMQSAAISLSPSFLASNFRMLNTHGFNATCLQRRHSGSVLTSLVLSSPRSISWISNRNTFPRFDVVPVRAIEEGADAAEIQDSSGVGDILVLGTLFVLWYAANIYFNIYNKQVLEVYPYPMTLSLVEFAVGTIIVILMWALHIYKQPNVSVAQLASILPLAVMHTLGTLFTNMSLGKVAVSFTHTIKAMEPFFTVVLSAIFLKEYPTILVVLSLVPIVGGVGLASMSEVSFNWSGFWSAMASNLTNQYRNVLSKQIMVKKEESMDNVNLFSVITIMSFILMIPTTIFMEGIKFTPSFLQAAELNVEQIFIRSLLAALCFHTYQQVAYMILQRVSPITHSVGNCVKRVVVIVASVLFFRTAVSPMNSIGTGIALAGVFLYARAKRMKPKQRTA